MSVATGGVASDKCLWENVTAFMTHGNGSQAIRMKFMMYVKKVEGEKFYGKTISRYVVEKYSECICQTICLLDI